MFFGSKFGGLGSQPGWNPGKDEGNENQQRAENTKKIKSAENDNFDRKVAAHDNAKKTFFGDKRIGCDGREAKLLMWSQITLNRIKSEKDLIF